MKNKIKETRQARGLQQVQVINAIVDDDARMDAPALSKIENGVFLPTVPVAKELCRVLECDILELYDLPDIDLAGLSAKEPKASCDVVRTSKAPTKTTYHLCVELPKEIGDKITDGVLQKCGFTTRRQWLAKCAERLLRRYDVIVKKEAARQTETIGAAKG